MKKPSLLLEMRLESNNSFSSFIFHTLARMHTTDIHIFFSDGQTDRQTQIGVSVLRLCVCMCACVKEGLFQFHLLTNREIREKEDEVSVFILCDELREMDTHTACCHPWKKRGLLARMSLCAIIIIIII